MYGPTECIDSLGGDSLRYFVRYRIRGHAAILPELAGLFFDFACRLLHDFAPRQDCLKDPDERQLYCR
jgi:hypothetical protein